MARTSGTRVGNGPGLGGPAKGAGRKDVANRAPPFEAGNKAALGYHDMTKSQRLAALDEQRFNIAMGLVNAQPVQMVAINSYENRHLGPPKQAFEHSGNVTLAQLVTNSLPKPSDTPTE